MINPITDGCMDPVITINLTIGHRYMEPAIIINPTTGHSYMESANVINRLIYRNINILQLHLMQPDATNDLYCKHLMQWYTKIRGNNWRQTAVALILFCCIKFITVDRLLYQFAESIGIKMFKACNVFGYCLHLPQLNNVLCLTVCNL